MQKRVILKSLLFLFGSFFLAQTIFAQSVNQNFNRLRSFDVQHYLIRTTFDRRQRKIYGETTVSLKPLKNNFNKFELDAVDLNFESVILDASESKLKFETRNDKVIVILNKSYSQKDLIKIRLKYSAKPKKGVYFVNARREDNFLLHDQQIWTQGEPEESRHWFPSYDFPDDKATTEQFLTVEKEETAISNGELLETTSNSDGTKTFHYRMNVPHSVYLTSFIIGKYVKFSDQYKSIPLNVYLFPGKEYLYKQAFGKTKEMMRVFESLTGIPYPYNKYDQTIVGNFNLGGMENITATTLSARDVFLSDINPLIVDDLISHELAHSWFGNLVTCRNWAELWLNEGFASFMEAAFREKMYGRDDYIRKIAEDRDTYFAEEAQLRRKRGLYNQLARPDDSIFDAVTYQKGSAVVHTLREEVGDEKFWKAVNVYLKKHQFENVETDDLRKVFEETTKRDLGWFFKQWVYGVGYPKLEVKYQFDEKSKVLNINVRQTQPKDEKTPSEFILPMEVEIQTADDVKTEKINITKRDENFSFRMNSAPTNIVFDKNLKIPLKLINLN